MIVTETKSQHSKELTKLGGTVYDKSGYRMDVNLWFRHKNEALFYIDSVGKVHGPMDQTYSSRLGPIQKSGNEITYRREFNEQMKKDQWQKSMEFQTTKLPATEVHHETRHFETILRDVTTNEMNNHRRSHLTLANHYIPSYKNVETNNYSTTITKQTKKPDQGVTVNIVAPTEKIIEKEISTTRERRLIDELLEAREELNTLRKAKSVVDNSFVDGDSKHFFSESHKSKVVTDVYPSTNSIEKTKRRHHSTQQEHTSRTFPESMETESNQSRQTFTKTHEKVEPTSLDKTFYSEIRNRHGLDKSSGYQIPITVQSGHRHRNISENVSHSNSRNVTTTQTTRELSPVQPVENVNGSSQLTNHHDVLGEEKTVTIKRKITKRKKANENINTLRDSYIDRINLTTQGFGEPSSDEDLCPPVRDRIQPETKETIIPTKSAPRFEQPKPREEVQEEIIVPKVNKRKVEEIPFERLDNLSQPHNPPRQTNDLQKNPDWDYRDHSINRGHTPQFQRHNISDTTTYNSYSKEKDTGTLSNYSARKENMRTQQMMDERHGSMRTLPTERRVNEMTEEIETITLQPIGKGIQDLAPAPATISRPGSRAATPRVFEGNTGTTKSNYYREEHKTTGGGYNTMPALPKFNKYSSARNVNQMSSYDIPDSYKRGLSTGRTGHEQVVNTTWEARTESYNDGHRNFQTVLSPVSHNESIMSSNVVMSGMEENRYPLQMVLNTEDLWYQPRLNREEVINALRERETGSFIIRNSSTFSGAYGLAVKVASLPDHAVRTNDAQGDLIRHFLIETVDDASGSGVRLKGFTNEPVYPSLAHLVQDHCQNARALPTKLIISTFTTTKFDREDSGMAQSQYQYESHQRQHIGSSRMQPLSTAQRSMSSPGVNFIHPNPLHRHLVTNALYLGKFDVDRLTGKAAIEQAVTKAMSKKNLKTTTTEIRLDSTHGITLTDKVQALFYTRQFPAQHVLCAEFDPKSREFASPILQNNGINRGRIIGIVIRKQKMILRENAVHLFCEIDKLNDLNDIIIFVNENYLRRA